MNKKENVKIFRMIFNRINKKFCKNKLVINKIRLFNSFEKTSGCGVVHGFYNSHKKTLGIKKDISLVEQIDTVCHELTHAYQHQIDGSKVMSHNKTGNKIYSKFLKSTDEILKL